MARGDAVTSPVAQPRADFRAKEKADTINQDGTNLEENAGFASSWRKIKGPRKYPAEEAWVADLGDSEPAPPHRAAPGRLLVSRPLIVNLASGNRRERCCLSPFASSPQRLILFF